MRRTTPLLLLGYILVFSTGCIAVLSDKNRPGNTDIEEPPPQMDEPERVVPDDPGGRFFTVGLAPTAEVGATFGFGSPYRTFQAGGELFLGTGTTDETGRLFGESFGRARFLDTNLLILGWTPFSSQDLGGGKFYGEVSTGLIIDDESAIIMRLSGGLSLRPQTRRVGAQVTLKYFEVSYLRVHWDFGQSVSLLYGVTFPINFAYLRSY